jgi:hypothetical protein
MTPFVIFALPRSQTAWTARLLSYGGWHCGHEELRHCRSMEDVESWLAQPATGTVETGAAHWWRFMRDRDVKLATIRRPVSECLASLMRLGIRFDAEKLKASLTTADHKLDQIERRLPGVLRVDFADLATEDGCKALFEHCLPYQHDHAWWQAVSAVNIQIDMVAMMRYFAAHHAQITKLAMTARHLTLAAMQRNVEIDGITIQQETLETLRRDGVSLFEEHCVAVGDAPDAHEGKDWGLMAVLEGFGALQITTARSNGRMFGYLLTVIGPALESPDITSATNTFFYASREFPGLGMKLQRASIEALRARGVTEVLMRAGTRGSGPRLSTLYRRLGAQFCGDDYLLKLKDAA